MVSPLVPPDALTVGVLSLVLLSVGEEPVSDAAARSTAVGALGAVVSTGIDRGLEAVRVLPAGSVRVAVTLQVPSARVPRAQLVRGRT